MPPMYTRLTEPQFYALLDLTSIHDASATCRALHQHLVLGYKKPIACTESSISIQTLNSALRRMAEADAAARRYLDSLAYSSPCKPDGTVT